MLFLQEVLLRIHSTGHLIISLEAPLSFDIVIALAVDFAIEPVKVNIHLISLQGVWNLATLEPFVSKIGMTAQVFEYESFLVYTNQVADVLLSFDVRWNFHGLFGQTTRRISIQARVGRVNTAFHFAELLRRPAPAVRVPQGTPLTDDFSLTVVKSGCDWLSFIAERSNLVSELGVDRFFDLSDRISTDVRLEF